MATTLSIELPAELADRLNAAGIGSEDAQRYALAALTEAADDAEVRAWWEGLSTEQQAAEVAKTRASLAAGDEGRVRSASEVYARVRARSVA